MLFTYKGLDKMREKLFNLLIYKVLNYDHSKKY